MKQDLSGLPVKCPNCKRVMFKTTIKFNPNETPRGDFVESLAKYQIDWLCSSTTLASEMTCPECCAQLVLNGRLTVLIPIRDVGEFFDRVTEEVAAAKKDELNKRTLDYLGDSMTPERVEEDTRQRIEALNSATSIDGGDKISTPMVGPEPVNKKPKKNQSKKRRK